MIDNQAFVQMIVVPVDDDSTLGRIHIHHPELRLILRRILTIDHPLVVSIMVLIGERSWSRSDNIASSSSDEQSRWNMPEKHLPVDIELILTFRYSMSGHRVSNSCRVEACPEDDQSHDWFLQKEYQILPSFFVNKIDQLIFSNLSHSFHRCPLLSPPLFEPVVVANKHQTGIEQEQEFEIETTEDIPKEAEDAVDDYGDEEKLPGTQGPRHTPDSWSWATNCP